MNFKMAIGAAVSSIMMASAAAAASLSIVGTDTGQLPGGTGNSAHNPDYSDLLAFDPTLVPTVGVGDTVVRFGSGYEDFNGSNGLQLSDDSQIRITYLGTEAAYSNTAINVAGLQLNNKTNSAGDYVEGFDLASWVDLTFTTVRTNGTSDTISNNVAGQSYGVLSVAFYQENSKNVLAFFGDGLGDSDFDDMVVRISVVPLPAGGVLLLTALGGMAVARRRKKAA